MRCGFHFPFSGSPLSAPFGTIARPRGSCWRAGPGPPLLSLPLRLVWLSPARVRYKAIGFLLAFVDHDDLLSSLFLDHNTARNLVQIHNMPTIKPVIEITRKENGDIVKKSNLHEFNTEAEIMDAPYFGPIIFAVQHTPQSIDPRPTTPGSTQPVRPRFEKLSHPENAFFLFKEVAQEKFTHLPDMVARLRLASKIWWSEWDVRREYEYRVAVMTAAYEVEKERRKTLRAQYEADLEAYEEALAESDEDEPIPDEGEVAVADMAQSTLTTVPVPADPQPTIAWTPNLNALDFNVNDMLNPADTRAVVPHYASTYVNHAPPADLRFAPAVQPHHASSSSSVDYAPSGLHASPASYHPVPSAHRNDMHQLSTKSLFIDTRAASLAAPVNDRAWLSASSSTTTPSPEPAMLGTPLAAGQRLQHGSLWPPSQLSTRHYHPYRPKNPIMNTRNHSRGVSLNDHTWLNSSSMTPSPELSAFGVPASAIQQQAMISGWRPSQYPVASSVPRPATQATTFYDTHAQPGSKQVPGYVAAQNGLRAEHLPGGLSASSSFSSALKADFGW
ncbi:hypothetical protein PENSPDRAFT_652429 [Peniophora sp. CONT]|nr:hypothetical protein PENSPDRAFT_652429 [Peniophora sp. CONT]